MSKPAAIVTRAGKGIGRAIAIELSRRGFDLTLTARTQSDLDETAKLVGGALAIAGDIADPKHVDRVVGETVKRFGRIDALVNNAGFAPLKLIEAMTIEEFRQVVDVNLSATFYFSKAVWPIFRQAGGGAIVNISSVAARDPFPGFAAYGAAKSAVNVLSMALAKEGQEAGIRVHVIAPGAVETAMFRTLLSKEQFPPEHALDPAEVARLAAECINGDLRHTSGEVIHVHKRL